MIDTGANISVIDEDTALKLDATVIQWPFSKISSVDDRDVTPKYIIKDVEIEFESKPISINMAIMEIMNCKVILGIDYIK